MMMIAFGILQGQDASIDSLPDTPTPSVFRSVQQLLHKHLHHIKEYVIESDV